MSSYSQFLWNENKGSAQHFPMHFQADGTVVRQCPSMIHCIIRVLQQHKQLRGLFCTLMAFKID